MSIQKFFYRRNGKPLGEIVIDIHKSGICAFIALWNVVPRRARGERVWGFCCVRGATGADLGSVLTLGANFGTAVPEGAAWKWRKIFR